MPSDPDPLWQMRKPELLAHGRQIGAPVKAAMTKPALVDAIRAFLAEHGPAARQHGSTAVPPDRTRERAGAAVLDPSGAFALTHQQPVAHQPAQQSPNPTGSLLHEACAIVRERWKSFSVVGAVIPTALFVDYYFFSRLGAHGQMSLSDRLMVWRAWPLLVVTTVAALSVFLPLLAFAVWRRRADGAADISSYAWWIATTGVTGFIVAFLLTSALGAVKNATVRIQAGQEVSAVLAPMTEWPLYFSDAYYVEHVRFKDQATQQRFEQAREPGEALTFMYLRAEGDADDKRVMLYDYATGDVTSADVVEFCAGSRAAPALSIGCVR